MVQTVKTEAAPPSHPECSVNQKKKNHFDGNFLKILSIAFIFVPPFSKKTLLGRLLASIIIIFLIWSILSAKFSTTTQLIFDAIAYNPVEHAQELVNNGHYSAAYDFLSFYEEIPGVETSQEFNVLKAQIENERASFTYRANEILKGLLWGESEEDYGVTAEMVTEVLAFGDVRALYRETSRYLNGEEVDELNAGLAGLGLVLSAAQAGPQLAAVLPFKSLVGMLRKSVALMRKSFRLGISKIFQPIIASSDVVVRSLKKGEIHPLLREVLEQCRSQFGSLADLARLNPRTALLVIRHSPDVVSLDRNTRLAIKMGPDAKQILAHGGAESLEAAAQLEKKGKLSGVTLKKAAKYGKPGYRALVEMSLEELEMQVRSARLLLEGRAWYYFKRLISLIPSGIAFSFVLYLALALCKTWFVARD